MNQDILISLDDKRIIRGILKLPEKGNTSQIVVFAHGSGSGRNSPRNQAVASHLVNSNLGTLLIDLLTEEEGVLDEMTRQHRFDIDLLASRLIQVNTWLLENPNTKNLQLSFFGASTGSAAALIAAAKLGSRVKNVVSRGGRVDLAQECLPKVKARTLFIVGGQDREVLKLNEVALRHLNCPKKLEVVEGATHLFEERGALEQVEHLASNWFGGKE